MACLANVLTRVVVVVVVVGDIAKGLECATEVLKPCSAQVLDVKRLLRTRGRFPPHGPRALRCNCYEA